MALTIDQQFIEYIVKTLVNKPEAVQIERTTDDRGVLLSLSVDPEDLGRVIGREGRTAQALRSLLRALGMKNDARYNLKIVSDDEGGERAPREEKAANNDESAEAPVEESVEVEAEEPVENSSESTELAEKTRQELADLDDLDI